jgi:acetyl esterase/lipase
MPLPVKSCFAFACIAFALVAPAAQRSAVAPAAQQSSVAPAAQRSSVAPAAQQSSVAPAAQQFSVAPAAQQSSDASATQVEENISYGTVGGTDLRLDVYEPAKQAGRTYPAVVLIHGGGWTSLDKNTMARMGQFLARTGFVGFAVNYRLFDGSKNRWPAQLDDVQRAVRWVRANAATYGVNPERMGAFGHSAGGQLAALLGMEDTRDNSDAALAKFSSRVQAVVDVSGPTDLTADRATEGAGFLANFLGFSYAEHAEGWRDASPLYRAAKGDAPFLIVHGTEDRNVPIAQSQALYEKLQSLGVPAKFLKVEDAHTFRTEAARREMALEAQAFFRHYLSAGQ